jgi:hypothetical protein
MDPDPGGPKTCGSGSGSGLVGYSIYHTCYLSVYFQSAQHIYEKGKDPDPLTSDPDPDRVGPKMWIRFRIRIGILNFIHVLCLYMRVCGR